MEFYLSDRVTSYCDAKTVAALRTVSKETSRGLGKEFERRMWRCEMTADRRADYWISILKLETLRDSYKNKGLSYI
jgi:hypothetical protein